jgi:hypothetical protein
MNENEANKQLEVLCADHIDYCPYCESKAHLVMVANKFHVHRNGDHVHFILFKCKPCSKISLKVFKFEQNPYSSEPSLSGKGWINKFPNINTSASEKFSIIPSEILSDYEEGLNCLNADAPRAAVSMFRRSLQNSLIELGADKELDLIDQIKNIDKLTTEIKDWAHNIRIFGNWGAHPQDDQLKTVNLEKANEVKDFIDQFFNYVFIMPSKVAKARESYSKQKGKDKRNEI